MTSGSPTRLRPACAILAGGQARRYGGRPKGLIDVGSDGRLVDRLTREVAAAGIDRIVIVANEPTAYADCGREVIPDLRVGLGPLGGIEAALAHFAGKVEAALILPCDLPALAAAEIRTLTAAYADMPQRIVVAMTEGFFWQPLCAVVHIDLGLEVSAAIDRGERRVEALWRRLGAAVVDFGQTDAFFNLNTPEDLLRWQESRN